MAMGCCPRNNCAACCCSEACCPAAPPRRRAFTSNAINLCDGPIEFDWYDPCVKKPKARQDNTLGTAVGVLKSTQPVVSSGSNTEDLNGQIYASCLKAFAKAYLTPASEWKPSVIDCLIKEGEELFKASKSDEGDESQDETKSLTHHVYTTLEAKIGRSFEFCGVQFDIELDEKMSMKRHSKHEDASSDPSDFPLRLFKRALKEFFKHRKYCLLRINDWYLLIFKQKGFFFVLDLYGRNLSDLTSDRSRGYPMLICLSDVGNVYHLINCLSNLNGSENFVLREARVITLAHPQGVQSRALKHRFRDFVIVNEDYAYLKSTLHLSLKISKPLLSRSALPAGVAAIIAAKIDHPASWNTAVFDQILCFGAYVCQYCWEQCLQSEKPVNTDEFPTQFKMGQFLVEFTLVPRVEEGIWKCVPNYLADDLWVALGKHLEHNGVNLLIQVNHLVYAVWKKNDFIYLFDPYRHRLDDDLNVRNPTVKMFATISEFFDVFNQTLQYNNKTTPFYIHKVMIKKIHVLAEGGVIIRSAEASDPDADVKSLNEMICFEQDPKRCWELLGQESEDDEEEDYEVEPSSESEVEIGGEEEGLGFGDIEEHETESSSSKDEKDVGGSKKKKTKPKKKPGKGNKQGKKGPKKPKDTDESEDEDDGSKDKKKKGHGTKKPKKPTKSKTKPSDDETDKTKEDEATNADKTEKPQKNKEKKEKPSKEKKPEDSENLGENEEKEKEKPQEEPEKQSEKEPEKQPEKEQAKKDEEPKGKDKDERDEKSPKEEDKKKDEPEQPPPVIPETAKDIPEPPKELKPVETLEKPKDEDFIKPPTPSDLGKVEDEDDDYLNCGTRKPTLGLVIDEVDDDLPAVEISQRPNNLPGFSTVAHDMAVVGSESGTYDSLCKLMRAGFKCADRVLVMTPWGNFVAFRGFDMYEKEYFLFDGCTCNVERFRHLDLNCGTAGLIRFKNLHGIISYMIDAPKIRKTLKKSRQDVISEICNKYCN